MRSILPHFAALLLLLAGCAAPTRRLDSVAVGKIQPGVSTRAEVEREFGQPRHVAAGFGRTLVIYSSGGARTTGMLTYEVRLRLLSVLYDAQGVVEKTLRSESRTPYRQGLFKEQHGRPLDRDAVTAALGAGATRDSVVQKFGAPTYELLSLENGTELTWVSGRERGAFVNVRQEHQELTIKVDERGNVVDAVLAGELDATPAAKAK